MENPLRNTLNLIEGPEHIHDLGRCEIKSDTSDVELLDAYSRAVITVADTVGSTVVRKCNEISVPFHDGKMV